MMDSRKESKIDSDQEQQVDTTLLNAVDETLKDATPTKKARYDDLPDDTMAKSSCVDTTTSVGTTTTVVSKLFNIDKVLKCLCQLSETKDLLEFRRVNTKWCEISTKILKGRPNLMVAFVDRMNKKSYSGLTHLFQQSKDFPCTRFSINPSHLGSKDVQSFLNAHGSTYIRKLQVFTIFPESDVPEYRKLLFRQAPNMEQLSLVNIPTASTNKISWQQLPNLKNIRLTTPLSSIPGDVDFIPDLFRAAVNLESFHGEVDVVPLLLSNMKKNGDILFEKPGSILPPIKKLELTFVPLEKFAETLSNIWKFFPTLQNLLICLDANFLTFLNDRGLKALDESELPAPAIDSAITGFGVADCIRLARMRKTVMKVWVKVKGQPPRAGPSILDMKDLKTCHFTFECEPTITSALPVPVFTRVSGVYGFEQMPGIQLSISYGDLRPSLENIQPWTTRFSEFQEPEETIKW